MFEETNKSINQLRSILFVLTVVGNVRNASAQGAEYFDFNPAVSGC